MSECGPNCTCGNHFDLDPEILKRAELNLDLKNRELDEFDNLSLGNRAYRRKLRALKRVNH